jgi:hypothetical protein
MDSRAVSTGCNEYDKNHERRVVCRNLLLSKFHLWCIEVCRHQPMGCGISSISNSELGTIRAMHEACRILE